MNEEKIFSLSWEVTSHLEPAEPFVFGHEQVLRCRVADPLRSWLEVVLLVSESTRCFANQQHNL